MINMVNSYSSALYFSVVRSSSQCALTAGAFGSSPFDKNLAYLTPFVALSIIAASPILYCFVPFTDVLANHFLDWMCGFLYARFCIYVIINMVKLLFLCQPPYCRPSPLSTAVVIHRQNQQYRAVYARVQMEHNGCCRHCNKAISEINTIVSKFRVRSSKYFHQGRAEK